MNDFSNLVRHASNSVKRKFSGQVDTAMILGSGLSDIKLKGFETIARLPYEDIACLPTSTAPGHKGELSIISNGHRTIAMCAGRHHLYEGYSAQEVGMLVYVMRAMGAEQLIITNAAGALNPSFKPGEVMLIDDHINFTGQNPLLKQDESLGLKFPDMSEAYNRAMTAHAEEVATDLNIKLRKGVYIGVTGPSLETSAERRMFRLMGADAIGMSTVTEVIAANHCGLKVLGLSAISNMAIGDEHQEPDTIENVLENAAIAGKSMALILQGLLK